MIKLYNEFFNEATIDTFFLRIHKNVSLMRRLRDFTDFVAVGHGPSLGWRLNFVHGYTFYIC